MLDYRADALDCRSLSISRSGAAVCGTMRHGAFCSIGTAHRSDGALCARLRRPAEKTRRRHQTGTARTPDE